MRIFKYLILFIAAFTLASTSCKKDGTTKTKAEMLTSKQWKILSYKENGVPVVMDNCEKDDFVKFEVNGTYTYNPLTVKCYPDDEIQNGTWSLSSDGKTITLDGTPSTVVELTESRFVFSIVDGTAIVERTFVAF